MAVIQWRAPQDSEKPFEVYVSCDPWGACTNQQEAGGRICLTEYVLESEMLYCQASAADIAPALAKLQEAKQAALQADFASVDALTRESVMLAQCHPAKRSQSSEE